MSFVRALASVLFILAGCKGQSSPPSQGGQGAPGAEAKPSLAKPKEKNPVNAERLLEISKLTLPFPEQVVAAVTEEQVKFRVKTSEPKRIGHATISACKECWKMEIAVWKPHAEALKSSLPPAMRDDPTTKFEIGEMQLGSDKVIFTYWAAVSVGEEFSNAHAVTFHWNDGVNQLRVTAQDGNVPSATTVEQLVGIVPRAELEAAAMQLFTALRPTL